MKTLFRSTETTLQMITSGHIQRETLATGLFILDRPRAAVMNFDACRDLFASWCETCVLEEAELELGIIFVNAHEQLVDALLEAESDGRVVWSKTGSEITYHQVDDLLSANGEQDTTFDHSKDCRISVPALDESVRNDVI